VLLRGRFYITHKITQNKSIPSHHVMTQKIGYMEHGYIYVTVTHDKRLLST